MKTNTPELYNSNIIDEILDEISPEDLEKTSKKMKLAITIAEAIKSKGWKKIEFAKIINQKPSVISKWLSGTHNFTIDTLIDLENVLNIKLLNVKHHLESVVYSSTVESTVDIYGLAFWNQNLLESISTPTNMFKISGNLLAPKITNLFTC